jgi:uncharacterized protein (TIGR03437 family)
MFTVNSGAGCAWTTTSSASWIRLTSGQTGSGTGQVGFAVESNTGDARTATLSVAGQTFTVTQASLSCAFTLTPGAATVPSAGGTAAFGVSAPASCAWTAASTVPWITIVSGASGSGAGVVGIAASPNSDAAARVGTVTVGGQTFTVTQSGSPIQTPEISIVNAASRAGGAVSPGMVVVIAVPGKGPAENVTTQLNGDTVFLTTQLGETRVLFDGTAAPMVYAASGECGAIVPYAVAGKNSTEVQVEFKGVPSNSVTIPVVQSSPGVFSLGASGAGPGAILDALGNTNSAANPAPKGSVVVLYATGEGQTSAPGIDGRLAVKRFPQPILPVSVTIDGIDAAVSYAGAAPGLVAGVMQIVVRVPDGARSGAVPVSLNVGPFQSQAGVTVAVQ